MVSIPDAIKPFLDKYKPGKIYPAAITVDDIPESIPYVRDAGLPRNGLHLGQRKLALSEIQFLTEHPCEYLIYAGSSPSNKIYFIANLFPKTRFILVDPRKPGIFIDEKRTVYDSNDTSISDDIHADFATIDHSMPGDDMIEYIKGHSARIFTIKGYFNNGLAAKLAPLGANFISDIRSISERHDIGPRDIDVLWNMAQQYNWMRILEPPMSCVKFRQVFYEPDAMEYLMENVHKDFYRVVFEKSANDFDLDFIEDYKNKKLRYPKGTIYLQAFPGLASTETRLHISANDLNSIKDYDLQSYEDNLNFYKSFYRTYVLHENSFVDKKLCTDNCNDCAIEAHIWQRYLARTAASAAPAAPAAPTARTLIEKLGLYSKPLCGHGWHGNLTSAKAIKENMEADLIRRKGGSDDQPACVNTWAFVVAVLIFLITLIVIIFSSRVHEAYTSLWAT